MITDKLVIDVLRADGYSLAEIMPWLNARNKPDQTTLRDYFAANAMQGLIASPRGAPGGRDATNTHYAKMAYVMADAMLEERK